MQSSLGSETVVQATSSLDDQDLLGLYERTRESCYLEELVKRYHGLVVSVVRGSLCDTHDIQDAVQATFLILVKSALKIQQRQSLAAWLHGVAYRTARRIHDRAKRDRSTQDASIHADELIASQESPLELVTKKFQLDALDEELRRVRETYRAVLVEHYLMGKTAAEIAASCNLSQSTVEGRLRRGRQQLRMQMLRRGFGFSAAVAASSQILSTHNASAAELTSLVNQVAAYSGPDVSHVPTSISTLVTEELSMSSLITSKLSLAILVGSLTVVALGVLTVTATGGQTASVTELKGEAQTSESASSLNVVQNVQPVEAKANGPASASLSAAQSWPSPSKNRVQQALRRPVLDILYNAEPLQQLLDMLADDFNLAMRIDLLDLERMGISPDQPVTIFLPPSQPLYQVLDYILSPLELSYRVDGDVLLVSSRETLDRRPNLRVYDLSIFENPSIVTKLEQYIRAIQADRWEENLWSVDQLDDQRLLVSVSDPVQAEIEAMLADLAQQLGKPLPGSLPESSAVQSQIPAPVGMLPGARGAKTTANPFADNPFGGSQTPSNNPVQPGGDSSDPFGSGK
ncbi:MAG: sigma-70 family RNA polymerase sigma factor [Pirellulaceae bacterium]|nr:sigma-70 family RNA polymerase sigma factor [Pirellulaceae bacterium]